MNVVLIAVYVLGTTVNLTWLIAGMNVARAERLATRLWPFALPALVVSYLCGVALRGFIWDGLGILALQGILWWVLRPRPARSS